MTDVVHAGEADRWGGWSWREPSRGEHFRRCSYCGSMHPDDLAEEIRRGPLQVDWADQKYGWPHKVYVHVPNRDPKALFPVSSANFQAAGMIPVDNLTPEQEAVMARHGYEPGSRYRPQYVQFDTRTDHFGKFYTVHLADPEISDDVKDRIQQRIGLRFEFFDGKVRWWRIATERP